MNNSGRRSREHGGRTEASNAIYSSELMIDIYIITPKHRKTGYIVSFQRSVNSKQYIINVGESLISKSRLQAACL